MLKKVQRNKQSATGPFAIVAAKFNAKYVDAMVDHAKKELQTAGVERIDVVRVPGTFEIPVVANRLSESARRYTGIICLGVVLRGETTHAHYIVDAVTHGLTQIQLRSGIPVIDGVYLFENEKQAQVRCLGEEHNRGKEVANVAIEMEQVMRSLSGLPKKPEGGLV